MKKLERGQAGNQMILLLVLIKLALFVKKLAAITALVGNASFNIQVQVMQKTAPRLRLSPILVQVAPHILQNLESLDQSQILIFAQPWVQTQ